MSTLQGRTTDPGERNAPHTRAPAGRRWREKGVLEEQPGRESAMRTRSFTALCPSDTEERSRARNPVPTRSASPSESSRSSPRRRPSRSTPRGQYQHSFYSSYGLRSCIAGWPRERDGCGRGSLDLVGLKDGTAPHRPHYSSRAADRHSEIDCVKIK